MQFHNYAYKSQLYGNRVAFFLLDRDEYDPSSDLHMNFPKKDTAYYVLYEPTEKRNGGVGVSSWITSF